MRLQAIVCLIISLRNNFCCPDALLSTQTMPSITEHLHDDHHDSETNTTLLVVGKDEDESNTSATTPMPMPNVTSTEPLAKEDDLVSVPTTTIMSTTAIIFTTEESKVTGFNAWGRRHFARPGQPFTNSDDVAGYIAMIVAYVIFAILVLCIGYLAFKKKKPTFWMDQFCHGCRRQRDDGIIYFDANPRRRAEQQ